jgi:hypothetical protein
MIDISAVLDQPERIPKTGNRKQSGGLKITFGLDLDGYQDLQPRDRFNESICGPQGFLRLIELRLGLASKPASVAGRIVQYREFLQNAASIRERFYTASFAKDPLAVAETLLRWRDELVLAGWDVKPGESRRIKLDYDGSIAFVSAYSEITLAHLAAQLFQRSRLQNGSATLIAQSPCSHLDTALRSLDEPVLGLSVRSAQRPVLQTLALALALRWEPLDPRDLLAFLIHPVSPMNKGLRDKLACAVAERPGIGGIEWNGALAANEAFLVNKFSADASGLKKALKKVEESLSRWVVVPRFDPQAGAPGSELAETCTAMAPWAMTQAGNWRRFCGQFQLSRELNWIGSSTRSSGAEFVVVIPLPNPDISTVSPRQELSWNLPKPCCGGIFEDRSLRRERRGQRPRSSSSNDQGSSFCCQSPVVNEKMERLYAQYSVPGNN